jgi:hypothetical protein
MEGLEQRPWEVRAAVAIAAGAGALALRGSLGEFSLSTVEIVTGVAALAALAATVLAAGLAWRTRGVSAAMLAAAPGIAAVAGCVYVAAVHDAWWGVVLAAVIGVPALGAGEAAEAAAHARELNEATLERREAEHRDAVMTAGGPPMRQF